MNRTAEFPEKEKEDRGSPLVVTGGNLWLAHMIASSGTSRDNWETFSRGTEINQVKRHCNLSIEHEFNLSDIHRPLMTCVGEEGRLCNCVLFSFEEQCLKEMAMFPPVLMYRDPLEGGEFCREGFRLIKEVITE